ncbi:lipopolysaccharide biosynthesis protein [Exiguobacterium sp. s80]|uniref:lipopolysaccharide biosynthesis protein n=1 Tax=Exiguobacterium sp. s80 TaxID=2751209 RepID=UPI001BE60286|nr:oligosaccharide flippase family protein [Exiguobacterium sp. s80]
MKKIFNKFIKDFSFTLTSNLFTLIVSILITLIVPKILGVQEYGYFQLYLFYGSYLGFLQFGWNDGIYLRKGGIQYSSLNKNEIFSQFWTLFFSQVLLCIFIIIIGYSIHEDKNKIFIFLLLGLSLVAIGTRAMLWFLFQATNRFSEFGKAMIVDRFIYLVLVSIFLLVGVKSFKYIVLADLISKYITLWYSMLLAKDVVFLSPKKYVFEGKEIKINISVGINLMFANISSMLILGVIRYSIERVWDVETFGKVSLILSISTMMLFFINAMSIVLFPMLRRVPEESLVKIYLVFRDLLMLVLMATLLMYIPLKMLLSNWLPNYRDSINYLFLIFPIIIFEGKMSLLINTYLKTLRKEKIMLRVNLLAVTISVLLTSITAFLLQNLYLTMLIILIVLAIRCILAELLLSNILKINLSKDIIQELLLTIIFIVLIWFFNENIAFIGYLISYLVYIIFKIDEIKKFKMKIKLLLMGGMK